MCRFCRMRPSLRKHVLAVLREDFLNMKQPELKKLIGCSLGAIQSIESGRLKLSAEMIQRISFETNVHWDWLAENNPAKPPINIYSQPYSREDFIRVQAK